MSKALDKTVARKVEREHFICKDCEAIEQTRAKFHKDRAHTDERCDCDDYVFYVGEYIPVPKPT